MEGNLKFEMIELIFSPGRVLIVFSDKKKPDKSGRKFEIALTATVLDGSSSSFHQVGLISV